MPHRAHRAAGALLVVGLLTAAAPSEPPLTDSQMRLATDEVLPAVVEVVQDIHGSVVDTRDGSLHGPYDDSYAGTGFFVSADGYIVTAAHVASPTDAELADELTASYIDELYHCDPGTAADQCAGVESQHHDEVAPHVRARDTTTALSVLLQSMDPNGDGMPATLTAASRSDHLDIAVVHAGVHDAPVALLAEGTPATGTPLTLIGYPAPTDPNAPETLVPTVTTGRVLHVLPPDPTSDVAPGATTIETDAGAREGNSGGPGITSDGTVQGIVSYGTADTDNFLPDAADIRTVVAGTPASNRLGRTDDALRAGLLAERRGDLAAAAADFRTCASLFPAAVQCADHARADATGGHVGGGGGATGPVAGALATIVAVAMAVLAVALRRRRRGPATVSAWPPPPPPAPPP